MLKSREQKHRHTQPTSLIKQKQIQTSWNKSIIICAIHHPQLEKTTFFCRYIIFLPFKFTNFTYRWQFVNPTTSDSPASKKRDPSQWLQMHLWWRGRRGISLGPREINVSSNKPLKRQGTRHLLLNISSGKAQRIKPHRCGKTYWKRTYLQRLDEKNMGLETVSTYSPFDGNSMLNCRNWSICYDWTASGKTSTCYMFQHWVDHPNLGVLLKDEDTSKINKNPTWCFGEVTSFR